MGFFSALLILVVVFYFVVYKNKNFFTLTPGINTSTSDTTTTPVPTTTTDSAPTSGGSTTTTPGTTKTCTQAGWKCITHPERLQVQNCDVTVTGTVIAAADGGPHFAPDGDLVFALKQDPQYNNLVNAKNNAAKYGGGLWIEGVCQQANKATEAKHQGDCAAGCGAPKFTTPKVGQRLRVRGSHIIDVGEDGHAEIHPATEITPITTAATARFLDQNSSYYYQSQIPKIDTRTIRFSNLVR